MENKRVFMGNLDFTVTEEELKVLVSGYGTVVHIKLHKKKGYAFIEMSDEAEAALVIEKLNGTMFKDREIRTSLKIKPRKAKVLSIKKYRERMAGHPGHTHAGNQEKGQRNGVGPESFSPHPRRNKWSHDKPAYLDRPPRDGNKSRHDSSSRPETNYNTRDRFPGPEDRLSGNNSRKISFAKHPHKKEWSHDKPAFSNRPPRDGNKFRQDRSSQPETNYNTKDRFPGPYDKPSRKYSRERSDSSHPNRKYLSHDKPATAGRHSGPSRHSESENRNHSRPHPGFSAPKKFSRSGSGSGAHHGSAHTSRPKARRGAGNRDRNTRFEKG